MIPFTVFSFEEMACTELMLLHATLQGNLPVIHMIQKNFHLVFE